ncbi:MAG: pilus assembly protein [Caldilineaceae bacterium]|jgi:hypothetical protein|nr:pilus assembly protein [Caldilineaceae bacterium]
MNKLHPLRGERGQVLIQFAVIFLGLLAFVALTIEAGNVYSVRRQLQNAADAGALAAARELCLNHSEQAATAKAKDYMVRNGLNADALALSEVTINGHRVKVTARMLADTIMARAINWNEVTVGASAKAACGGVNGNGASACGLWPVAVDLNTFENAQCGQSIVVWDADNDKISASCTIGGGVRDVCDCYDCDLDDDGSNDFVIATTYSRGWMDFPDTPNDSVYTDPCKSNGCGASELACRLRSDYGGRVTLPACIAGLRGIKAGVKDDVNARAGQTVGLPLFTSINCASGSNCSGSDAESYYVTNFGCASVTGWIQNFVLNPKPGMPKSIKKISSKAVLVTKDCSGNCMTFCGSTTGEPPKPWEMRAASLVP